MKEKQFEPARGNTSSPAPGLAAVNTHNPDEEPVEKQMGDNAANKGKEESEAGKNEFGPEKEKDSAGK